MPANAAGCAAPGKQARGTDGRRPVNLTDVSIRNPVFAWMLMASTILFGIISVTRLGISQYPDVDYPNVTVSLSWPGASPTAIEREILEPIEESLAQVEGVQTIQAQARQGSARITCTFDMSRNVDLALQDVQAKVAQTQRSLPNDVPAATVSKSQPRRHAHRHRRRLRPVLAADALRRRQATRCRRSCRRSPASGRSRSTATSIATSASGSTPTA